MAGSVDWPTDCADEDLIAGRNERTHGAGRERRCAGPHHAAERHAEQQRMALLEHERADEIRRLAGREPAAGGRPKPDAPDAQAMRGLSSVAASTNARWPDSACVTPDNASSALTSASRPRPRAGDSRRPPIVAAAPRASPRCRASSASSDRPHAHGRQSGGQRQRERRRRREGRRAPGRARPCSPADTTNWRRRGRVGSSCRASATSRRALPSGARRSLCGGDADVGERLADRSPQPSSKPGSPRALAGHR